MLDDPAIVKRIWSARVPVCFTLAQEELTNEDRRPLPIYMLLPRLSYFPLVMDRIIRHFMEFTESTPSASLTQTYDPSADKRIDSETDSLRNVHTPDVSNLLPEHGVWLDYANQPLKWHYPIGLLYDLHVGGFELPWKLTVHFHSYPTDVLLPPPVHRRAVETHYMSMVKEADALKHRSAVMNQMQAHDHRQLWTGLLNYQFDQFWAVNHRLMEIYSPAIPDGSSPVRSSKRQSDPDLQDAARLKSSDTKGQQLSGFRYIPCRLYILGEHKGNLNTGFIQKRVSPFTSDGLLASVGDVLRALFPSDAGDATDRCPTEGYVFLLHGITLPLETPVQWASQHMSYADNFLHIVAWPSSRFCTTSFN